MAATTRLLLEITRKNSEDTIKIDCPVRSPAHAREVIEAHVRAKFHVVRGPSTCTVTVHEPVGVIAPFKLGRHFIISDFPSRIVEMISEHTLATAQTAIDQMAFWTTGPFIPVHPSRPSNSLKFVHPSTYTTH
jgi:hypothetical protein